MCRVLKMTHKASVDPNSDSYLSGDELELWTAAHEIQPFEDGMGPQDFAPTTKRRSQQTPEEMASVFESLKADASRR